MPSRPILRKFDTPPVGTIVAYSGVFAGINNGGAFDESLVEISPVLKLCDGSQISDSDSPFDGRFVPKLDDGRFLKGNTTRGTVGGNVSLNPKTAFAETESYSPSGSLASHDHTATHDHPLFTTGVGAPTASVATSNFGGSTRLADRFHTHNVNFPNLAVTTSAISASWTGNSKSRADWFQSFLNIEPKYLDVKYFQRIK